MSIESQDATEYTSNLKMYGAIETPRQPKLNSSEVDFINKKEAECETKIIKVSIIFYRC